MEIVLTHFIVSDDVERSGASTPRYSAGGSAFPGDAVNVALANSWIVVNGDGGPTDKQRSSCDAAQPRPGQQLR